MQTTAHYKYEFGPRYADNKCHNVCAVGQRVAVLEPSYESCARVTSEETSAGQV